MIRLLLFTINFLLVLTVFGQLKEITGTVTSKTTNAPLTGVTISSKNKTTTTDDNGKFSLEASIGDNLTLTFVGMKPTTLVLSSFDPLSISLEEDLSRLEDVVVTGYQSQRKADLTGAISVVNMNDVKNIPTGSPLQSLQGRVPGLFIKRDGTPGGGTNILIRGINTLGNNDPLFIIDGQPVESRTAGMLDPNDIESLQVLKDAASASIYGSRASNGVVIITTKRAKTGKLKVDFNSNFSLQQFYKHLDMLNTEERGRVLWQAAINDGTNPNNNSQYQYQWHSDAQGNALLDKINTNEWLDKSIQGGIRSGNTRWFDEISRQGYLMRNNIAISNSNENHNLLISVGHLTNKGVVKYTDYDQLTLRINSSFNALKGKLKIGENVQLGNTVQTPIGVGQGGTTLDLAILSLPILPVYAENGSFAGPVGSGFSNRMNPLQVAELSKDWKNRSKSIYGNVYLEFSPINNLTFKSSMGIDYSLNQEVRINPRFNSGFLSLAVNNYSNSLGQNYNWSWFNTLNYNREIGKSRFNILVGSEAIKNNTSFLAGYKENFLIETPAYFQINAGTGLASLTGNETGFKLLSYFSKINYSFNSKYLATLTLRSDGSSRFGAENKYGFFPAFSLGWRVSDENFIRDNFESLSQLMIRFGVGRTGNQKIANDASFGLFVPGYGLTIGRRNYGSAYDLNGAGSGTLPSGVVATQTANPSLKWESTNEINIGTDFGLFQQKVTGSFDFFLRKTNDILIKPPYLAVLGEGGSMWQNGATMENKGWEVSLAYNGRVSDFNYRIAANASAFRDKVTYLPASVVRAYPGNVEKTIIGQSLTSIFGYVTDGIFQNQSEVTGSAAQPGKGLGRIRYKDLNGDKIINVLDQTWIGRSNPDFEFGLNSLISYKQFTLSFFLQGLTGVEQYNSNKNQVSFVGAFAGVNNSTLILKGWTPQNSSADIPGVSNFDSNNEIRTSTFQVENGSYLKLRNIQFGYTIPKGIKQSLRMSRAEVFISGSDLFTFKSNDYTSPDPENPGSFYPISRTLTMGLNVSF
jgi:TonB-linked SusC/RagA family outer membrane protein